MRFLIDLQCAQSGSRRRGIGRYALSLLDALLPAAQAQGHEIHIMLNSALHASIPELQRRYKDLHRQQRIHVFHGLTGIGLGDANGTWRAAASAMIRDMAIAALAPDAVFCPSLFEGDSEDVAFGPLTLSDTPVIGAQHDLIPARMPEIYFDNSPAFRTFYEKRMEAVQSSDALICVSDATRAEALDLLEMPQERLHVVLEDADARFAPPDAMSLGQMEDLRRRHDLMRPYILYVGSGEPRKNLTGLIRAYAALPRGLSDHFDLAVAGKLTDEEIASVYRIAHDLRLDPGHIRLLGPVTDTDLPGLYGLATLFVMPSLREGFGLPALEAIRCGTLTLGAHTTSLPEVIGTEDALFDPTDSAAMSRLITRALSDAAFRDNLAARQSAHAATFSWERAARETLAVFTRYAKETATETDWPLVQSRLDDLEARTVSALRALPGADLTDRDRDDIARALARTRLSIEAAWRPRTLPEKGLIWRLEGPFDSSYSLASVNRETARALGEAGVEVALISAEGPGPFDADPDFLAAHPALAAQHAKGQDTPEETAHVLSRNMFPPRVADMRAPLNLLHGYAWEETGLPAAFTRDMTAHLQGLLVTSPHVQKLFEDTGIGLPVHVVGNGVDHLEVEAAPLPFDLPEAAFTCLHVSSCFPRKGVDVLLAAFGQAFGADDDVALIIKTFPNPHNDIHDQVAGMANVTVIEDDLSPAQMRSLYAAADLLVAPSRAEGYCLPVAEAVLAGTPALTTGWGGQRIFDGNPMVHFINYTFAPAQSHLGAWDSVWAEPDPADLVRQLRERRSAAKPDAKTRKAAAAGLMAEHSWDKVATRSLTAARSIAEATPKPPPKVGWVTSYNTRCGIATYSAHLIEAFPDTVTVFASHAADRPAPDGPEVRRCWHQDGQDPLADLQTEIDSADPQVLVIQFNYGFFGFPQLAALILKAREDGRQVVMMLHATDDSAVPPVRHLANILPALKACDRLLVHSHHDLNNLRAMGLEENVALFPHGVPYVDTPAPPAMRPDRPVTLGTYGFFLPPKGLVQLIDALARLRESGENVALEMVNAEYPAHISAEAIAEGRARIDALGLHDHIRLETAFLEDAESFARLARADALVFPYQQTAESASGAIRQALALNRPVIATPLRIFDDVDPLILRLPGTDAGAIAEGLAPLVRALRDPGSHPEITARIDTCRANIRDWRQSHAYSALAPRLWRVICGL